MLIPCTDRFRHDEFTKCFIIFGHLKLLYSPTVHQTIATYTDIVWPFLCSWSESMWGFQQRRIQSNSPLPLSYRLLIFSGETKVLRHLCAWAQSTWHAVLVGRVDGRDYDGQLKDAVHEAGGLCQRIWSALYPVFFADSDRSDGLRVSQMPRSPKVAIFVPRQT